MAGTVIGGGSAAVADTISATSQYRSEGKVDPLKVAIAAGGAFAGGYGVGLVAKTTWSLVGKGIAIAAIGGEANTAVAVTSNIVDGKSTSASETAIAFGAGAIASVSSSATGGLASNVGKPLIANIPGRANIADGVTKATASSYTSSATAGVAAASESIASVVDTAINAATADMGADEKLKNDIK